VSLNK